ncbi:MAG: hypothetical protein QXU18_00825 [Thermoplasmatales archaeon]
MNFAKFLVYSRSTHPVFVRQMLEIYLKELIEELGIKNTPSERSIYRSLEKIGRIIPVLLEKYQNFLNYLGISGNELFIGFPVFYFVRNRSDIGAVGSSNIRNKI